MTPFPVAPIVWKALAIGVALSSLWLHGCHHGKQEATEKLNTFIATAQVQQAQIDRSKKQSEEFTRESQKHYQDELGRVRAYYAERMRNDGRSGQLSAVPAAPERADVTASDPGFVGRCAETTQQLESLQDWIRKQQMVQP